VRDQVSAALACLGLDQDLAASLPVHPLQLHEPDLGGLPAADVFGQPCVYWHSAALVTFHPGRDNEMLPVNVAGTANALATFERHAPAGSRFVAVSTAYQCGLDTDNVPEQWPESAPPEQFHNFYEYTKREAELTLRHSRSVQQASLAVARLGVIVGHSRTGEALTDYGLYDFLRIVAFYAKRRPGERVRIPCHPNANLHFMPIDLTVQRLLHLADCPLDNPIFHLVGGGSVHVSDLFATINARLAIQLVPATSAELAHTPFTRFEAAINMQLKYTTTYLRQHYHFQVRQPLQPVAVTSTVLDRLITWYADQGHTPR
jgi:nucleoside-diphosphate-sugar epimerase